MSGKELNSGILGPGEIVGVVGENAVGAELVKDVMRKRQAIWEKLREGLFSDRVRVNQESQLVGRSDDFRRSHDDRKSGSDAVGIESDLSQTGFRRQRASLPRAD
jgi:hypothetical protein